MGISIDPRRCIITRRLGEFVCLFTHVNDKGAMVLMPAHRKGLNGGPPPWAIICDDVAWKYDNDEYLMSQAMTFCAAWGMTERASVVKLATIINEGLEDLLRLPPAPDPASLSAPGRTLGEADLFIAGDKIATTEVAMPTADDLLHFEDAPNGYQ